MDIDRLAGTRLGNYEIESLLGRGGMGVVYKARQISLNRPVALKILPPTLSSDSSFVKRFQREAQAVAQLDHPNIVQIFDIARAKGLHYFSMQYVEGRTLDAVLEEEGRLDVDEAIRIAIQAAQGIEHAHKNGIIHRDIKPSNIILDESGNAKVMDFGLARSTEERSKLTQSGTLMGTLDYMSPEQCKGDQLDGRTDIYSLGVVLYEALSGRAPFEAPNEAALINKIINEDMPDIQTLNPDVPISLSKIIFKATAKDKEDRYSEIGELLEDLRSRAKTIESAKPTTPLGTAGPVSTKKGGRMAAAAIIVALACLGIIGIVFLQPSEIKESKETESSAASPAPTPEEKTFSSIAVLPFADMSPEKDQEYLCDGLAEELINTLAQLQNLRVVARTSAFSFKGQNIDIRDIGEKLSVETVLEGSVRKTGNRLRITAQLVNVANGYHLWSEKYDREMKDIFAIQDEISLAIVDKLKIKLFGDEKARFAKHRPVDPEAYNLHLKGIYFLFRQTDVNKAEMYFKQALEKDPNCASAYTGLADLYNMLPFYAFLPPRETFPKAKEAAQKALELDDTLSEAHSSFAAGKMYYDWDWEGAQREYKRAIELSPGDAGVHGGYAIHLLCVARFDEAISEIEQSIRLDPFSSNFRFYKGLIFYYADRNEQALEVLKETVEMNPNFMYGHLWLGMAYLRETMYEEALLEFKKESAVTGGSNPFTDTYAGLAYMETGKKDETRRLLNKLLERSKQKYVPPTSVAWLYFILGEDDEGFAWLDKAYEAHDYWLAFMKVGPLLDSVSQDPRYIALLTKIGLEP